MRRAFGENGAKFISLLIAVATLEAASETIFTGPLANLRVELLDEVDGVLANTRTNAAGQYAFYRLSTGVFQVKVWATGTDYDGKTERVALTGSLGGGRAGQSEQVDFVLTPRKTQITARCCRLIN